MLRVKRGDMMAFEELVEKYKQPVMNLAYRTLQDATDDLLATGCPGTPSRRGEPRHPRETVAE